jgi:hypothetical protein
MQYRPCQEDIHIHGQIQNFGQNRAQFLTEPANLIRVIHIGINESFPGRFELMSLLDAREIASLPGLVPEEDDFLGKFRVFDFLYGRK